MGFLDFLGKVFGYKNMSEEDKAIKAIYAAVQKAENYMKTYNAAIGKTSKWKPDPTQRNIYAPKDIHKELKEEKLKNKVSVLSQLKKDINNILREF